MFRHKGKIYGAPVAHSFLVEDCNGPYEDEPDTREEMNDIDECPGWIGDAPTENEYKVDGALHGYGYIGNGAAQSHIMEGHYLGGIGGFGEDGGLPGGGVGNSVCSPFRASLTIPTKSGANSGRTTVPQTGASYFLDVPVSLPKATQAINFLALQPTSTTHPSITINLYTTDWVKSPTTVVAAINPLSPANWLSEELAQLLSRVEGIDWAQVPTTKPPGGIIEEFIALFEPVRTANIKWAIGSGHSRLWNTAGFLVGKKWDFGGLHMVLGGNFITGLDLEELNQMPELCSTILKAINSQATVTSSDRLSNLSDIEKRKLLGVEVAQRTEVEEFLGKCQALKRASIP